MGVLSNCHVDSWPADVRILRSVEGNKANLSGSFWTVQVCLSGVGESPLKILKSFSFEIHSLNHHHHHHYPDHHHPDDNDRFAAGSATMCAKLRPRQRAQRSSLQGGILRIRLLIPTSRACLAVTTFSEVRNRKMEEEGLGRPKSHEENWIRSFLGHFYGKDGDGGGGEVLISQGFFLFIFDYLTRVSVLYTIEKEEGSTKVLISCGKLNSVSVRESDSSELASFVRV